MGEIAKMRLTIIVALALFGTVMAAPTTMPTDLGEADPASVVEKGEPEEENAAPVLSEAQQEAQKAALKAAQDGYAIDQEQLHTALGPNLDGNRGPQRMKADFGRIAQQESSIQRFYEMAALKKKKMLEGEIVKEELKGKKLDEDTKTRRELAAGRAAALELKP